MPTRSQKSSVAIVVLLFGLLLIGALHAMSLPSLKLPLLGPWKERFQDVDKLNAYAKTHPIEIANAKIENYRIDGAVIPQGEFKDTDWKDVTVTKASLTQTVFRGGIIEDVDFSNSTFTDVTFEDVKLRGIRFFHATLNNVRFVRCTFNGVNIDQTKNSRIEVIDSKAISTSFSEGQLVAVFRNSKLFEGVELTDLQPPSSLTFEKSELTDVDMDRSKLQELLVIDTKLDGGLQVGAADSITIRNSSMDATFSATTVDKFTVENTDVARLELIRSKINKLSLVNCKRSRTFNMFEITIGIANVTGSTLNDFSPIQSKIGELHVTNSSISNSELKKMTAKTLTLENVTLDGTLDFTGSQVGEFKAVNVTKQPGLKLITTGSNVRF